MAAYGWGEDAPLEEWLFAEGHAFDFFQAVALLEHASGRAAAEAAETNSTNEPVRFGSSVTLAFPGTDVASIERPERPGYPPKMTVNFMGLAGALGPLPPPLAELVYQRAMRKDMAARDLLDLFNHRLISLAYRIRKHHRFGLGVRSPDDDEAARYLYAIIGLGTGGQRRRAGVPPRSLLHYAGLFADERRSMAGLEAILRFHFCIPVEGVALASRPYRIEPEDRTAIGRRGRNRTLGGNAILGRRFWDREASFDIRLGPLSIDTFRRFLPGGDALGPLCAIIRFYAGERFDFGVLLALRSQDAPPVKLGKNYGSMLGHTAFLGHRRKWPADPEVRLRSRWLRPRSPGATPHAAK